MPNNPFSLPIRPLTLFDTVPTGPSFEELWSTMPFRKVKTDWNGADFSPPMFYRAPADDKIYPTRSRRFKIENGIVFYRGVKVAPFDYDFYSQITSSNQYLSAVRLAKGMFRSMRDNRIRTNGTVDNWPNVMWDINDRRDGHYVRMISSRRMDAVSSNKEPKSTKRHVGVEIEFLSPSHSSDDVKQAFIDAGLHNTVTYHSDSSVQGECEGDCETECHNSCYNNGGECNSCECDCELAEAENCSTNHCSETHECECDLGCNCDETEGHEICVIAEANEIESIIKRVCEVLNNKLDARVNKTCGLHVHLDARRKNPVKMYEKLSSQVEFIASLVPQSRRRSTYCQVNPKNRSLTEMLDNGDRYWMINPQSLRKHSTIEIRAHSGTTDPIKIIKWVKLMSWLAYTRKATDKIESFEQLIKEGFDLKDTLYFVDRFDKFKDTRPSRQLWTPLTGIDTLKQMTLNENASEAS